MKDHIKEKLAVSTTFDEVKAIIDDYMDYYNNRRYQWHLAKLAPNEYYQFVTAGGYPLDVASVPPLPKIAKESAMLRGGFWRSPRSVTLSNVQNRSFDLCRAV